MALRRIVIVATAFFALISARCAVSASPDPDPGCAAFVDERITYVARQRAVIELYGYVHTGDQENLDRDAVFLWTVDNGGYIVGDPKRHGRAFFHPGYRQATYIVTLNAISGGKPCASAKLKIAVDVEYTQYLQAQWAHLDATGSHTGNGSLVAARLVDEFTQLLFPLYVAVEARRVAAGSGSALGESDVEYRGGVKLFDPRIYVGASHRTRTSAGGITLSGMGYGIEKVPDIDVPMSGGVFVWYYPSFGKGRGYHMLAYGASMTRVLPKDRYFIEVGARRDHGVANGTRLRNFDDVTPFAAVGLRL